MIMLLLIEIGADRIEWKRATGLLCDLAYINEDKGNFSRTITRSSMVYELQYWATQEHFHI